MAQIGRIPEGFLDLVGAETSGRTPSQYADFVTPGVDLTDLYSAQALAGFRISGAHTAHGQLFSTVVPAGELWLLDAVTIQCTPPAPTDFERWTMEINNFPRAEPPASGGAASCGIWTSRLIQVQIGSQTGFDGFAFPNPIPLPPGLRIQWRIVERDASASRTSEARIAFRRLGVRSGA